MKLKESPKLLQKIFQEQMKEKYLEKDIYPQNYDRKIWWPKIKGKNLKEENY